MEIKGLILHARKAFVIEHFGEEAWQKVLSSLPERDREVLSEIILTAQWYPFEIGSRLDNAIVKVLGGGDKKIFEEIGVKSAQRGLLKIHQSFLTPGDPQAFMKKAKVIYKFYYDTGYREYEETGPTSGVMTTYEAETFSQPDCLTVIGWYKEALKLCGAREVEVVEEECRARGGSCCRYRFKWVI
ncbi:MAG: heme NO-binding domain-containing protein [Candidatus Krumholzibacteriota bacterium]|nr:heme NO-binding domain-containing protein [Candidatus Krumholzibacteriota bacterium]